MNVFETSLAELRHWRANAAETLAGLRTWASSARLIDEQAVARLAHLERRLSTERLTIAFVGEAARGKGELINALFFAEGGARLLPSIVGKTIQCPTEILWDDTRAPSIRLLPSETRDSPRALRELLDEMDTWQEVPLDPSQPQSLAKACEVLLDAVDAKAPRWRYAVINIPHPLLASGLVVLDTAGYTTLAPGWPDDPETVEEAKANPDAVAGKSIGQVADHFETVIRQLDRRPAIVGHSFGGLLTEILAGRGLAFASVAISPAPFRGVLPLPLSALRSGSPVLSKPGNYNKAVPLTYDQFRYAFANAVDEEEAKRLYDSCAVPAPGKPLFQAAAANLNPWTEAKVDTKNPDRGPLLLVYGEEDHTVPKAIVKASFKKEKKNKNVTELAEMKGRGHALTIDSGWQEVADTALAFVKRFV